MYTSDASRKAPALRVYLNEDNLRDLRAETLWPRLTGHAALQYLASDGFEGLQRTEDVDPLPDAPLPCCGCDRINLPAEADAIAAKHLRRGHTCLTVHAGWGLEDDAQVDRLVEAILHASHRHGLPIFLETHRATITQDLWRTVEITKRFPEIRFNGDFSHYYAGQELVYGGLAMKLDFMEPIFNRVGFMHGRVASPGCMQVPMSLDPPRPSQAHGVVNYLADFREIWIRAMLGFLRGAGPGDYLIFTPELLAGTHYYARLFPDAQGRLVEETDRYQQALVLKQMARECFREAQARLQTAIYGSSGFSVGCFYAPS